MLGFFERKINCGMPLIIWGRSSVGISRRPKSPIWWQSLSYTPTKYAFKNVVNLRSTRGRSSVGRAPALQAGGQEFDSPRLHQLHLENCIANKRRTKEATNRERSELD